MDDSLQVIIYIVFLAIYFLSRFLKGKKQPSKKHGEQEREHKDETSQQTDQPMTFEDLLKEITQPKEKQKPKAAPKPAAQEYEFREDIPDDDEIQEVYEESRRKAEGVKTLNEIVELGEDSIKFQEYEEDEEENNLANEIKEMLQNTDDARKAIVLKEILDRKF